MRYAGPYTWLLPAMALINAHSLMVLAFLAHDVSHSTVIRKKYIRIPLETLLWAMVLIPVTLWRRIHNQTHHNETNTLSDPDRRFLSSERNTQTTIYSHLILPNRYTARFKPLVGLQFIVYIYKHLIAAFVGREAFKNIVSHTPKYTFGQRCKLTAELSVVIAIQFGIFLAVGGRWQVFIWASPITILLASSCVMLYVFTNHFLNPLCEDTDPLMGSTSVAVPEWVDKLHTNFSYHTEHHLFPGMNSIHYPMISKLLQQHFPERYNRVPFRVAWMRLWLLNDFLTPNEAGEGQF